MQTICAFESVSWDTVASVVIHLLREQKRVSQSTSSGNHSKDIKCFFCSFLHCTVDKLFIPRPLWQAVHRTPPNQVLRYDFLYIQNRLKSSNHPFEYVLVLKHDFSEFAELISATAADHLAVVLSCSGTQGFACLQCIWVTRNDILRTQ